MNSLSFLSSVQDQRIVVAPLCWGLGHATRVMPIISRLSQNNEVIIASDSEALDLLMREYPDLDHIELPAYDIRYDAQSLTAALLRQSPKLLSAVSQEMSVIDEYVRDHGVDWVISDHRLGARSERCRSTIIAHQIRLRGGSKLMASLGSRTNRYFINQYDECWIPDYERRDMSLAGELSDSKGLKSYRHIGPLSRLSAKKTTVKCDVAIVLSGPEPARSHTEQRLYDATKKMNLSFQWVRGTSSDRPEYLQKQQVYDICGTSEMSEVLSSAEVIISRSGYSTIMDLEHLQKKAVLIPTPGQTEQEYLSTHLNNRSRYIMLSEDELSAASLEQAIRRHMS